MKVVGKEVRGFYLKFMGQNSMKTRTGATKSTFGYMMKRLVLFLISQSLKPLRTRNN